MNTLVKYSLCLTHDNFYNSVDALCNFTGWLIKDTKYLGLISLNKQLVNYSQKLAYLLKSLHFAMILNSMRYRIMRLSCCCDNVYRHVMEG